MNVKLIEVDCNSLFSKWFSESGKLMTDMFAKVQSLASDPDNYVCILIDEVESISVSRKALFKGSEPSDSIRAVNVLLTQLDKIKLQSNVLVLSTSNLIETIDPAFLDRVDCCYKMGLPGSAARYRIIATAIKELMRVGLVQDVPISGYNLAVMQTEGTIESKIISIVNSLTNNSGRNINKLPFLAFSKAKGLSTFPINVWRYLACLEEIAKDNLAEGREI
jgi:SpoVK/Ycf46/Vps4 family AAA+-type ATPase